MFIWLVEICARSLSESEAVRKEERERAALWRFEARASLEKSICFNEHQASCSRIAWHRLGLLDDGARYEEGLPFIWSFQFRRKLTDQ